MKRILAILLCVCLAMTAAGCRLWCEVPTQPPATTVPTSATDPVPTAFTEATVATEPSIDITIPTAPVVTPAIPNPIYAIALPRISESVTADDGTVLFTRTYQDVQLTLGDADLVSIITNDFNARISAAQSAATGLEDAAKAAYTPGSYWTPYFIDVSYTPTRIDKAVLSLFGNHTSYGGAAYPTLITESITYDLSGGGVLSLDDILAADYPGSDLCGLIVEALSLKATELYYDFETVLKDRFSGNYRGITSWYFSENGLCFHFAPSDIAPYSSGTVIAEIPYEKLSGILQDTYMPTDKEEPTGSMYAELFLSEDLERFSFTADVVLSESGTRIILHPDATVQDVQIESGSWSADGTKYIPTSTVFATDALELGHAIILLADLSENAPTLRLIYRVGNQEASAFIIYDRVGDTVYLAHG